MVPLTRRRRVPAWVASFQYRDFRYLWLSSVVQSVGMGMEFVALGWLVLDMTGSPLWVGVASAARMLPFFVMGFVSGAVADRVDRRIFVRWMTLAGAGVAALTALVLYVDYAPDWTVPVLNVAYNPVWPIIALTVVMGVVWVFGMTLRQAYTYDIVGPEAALNGMSLSALSQRLGQVMSAPVAGAILAVVGFEATFLTISVCYAASTVLLFWTREAGQAAARTPERVWTNLVGYWQILRENATLLTLMLLAAATEIFGFTHQSLLPVLAREELGAGSFVFGLMSMFQQGGGVIGLTLLAAMGGGAGFRRKGLLIFVIAGGFGLGEMAFSLGGGFALFVAALAFINACAAAVDTLYKTLMQEVVPNEQRGRAMGAWVFSIGVAPVGHIGVGALAEAFGAPRALLINGSALLGISLATALSLPKIRRLP